MRLVFRQGMVIQLVPVLGRRKHEIVHVGCCEPNTAQNLRSLVTFPLVYFVGVREIEGNRSSPGAGKLYSQNFFDPFDS